MDAKPQSITIHLVEDSDLFRELLVAHLSPIPNVHVVGFSTRAGDAIAQIRSLRPKLVILDLQLEAGTGFEVMRGLSPGRDAPHVIVLTNQSDATTRAASLAAGAAAFFDKSTEFQAFLSAVARFIDDHSAGT